MTWEVSGGGPRLRYDQAMADPPRLFPALLKHWRRTRGLSQLDLAGLCDVSARHLSFLETGRSKASADMVLRLAATLELPLRQQNELLVAAGHPAHYPESAVGSLDPMVEAAVARMLAVHEPLPMLVFNRYYDVLRTNGGAMQLLARFVAEPARVLARPRQNILHLLFDPDGLRPFVEDWQEIAHEIIARLHREALGHGGDARLSTLLAELLAYPEVPERWRYPDFSHPNRPAFCLWLRRADLRLGFLTALTVFNAPYDVGLEDLRIESYFPLDAATQQACESWV